MPRSRNYKDIDATPRRKFIANKDWTPGDTRNFFLNGFERVTRNGRNGSFEKYFVYLIPLEGKGIGDELTLDLFDNQAIPFQTCNASDYEEIIVTKQVSEKKGTYYDVKATGNLLPVEDRPPEVDYGVFVDRPYQPTQTATEAAARSTNPGAGEEINIDDIPF